MECRRDKLYREYGKAYVDIITLGAIKCPVCKTIHKEDEKYEAEAIKP